MDAPAAALRRLRCALSQIWTEYQQTGHFREGASADNSAEAEASSENILFLRAMAPLSEFALGRFAQQASALARTSGSQFPGKLDHIKAHALEETLDYLKDPDVTPPGLCQIIRQERFSPTQWISGSLDRKEVELEFLAPAVQKQARRERRKTPTAEQEERARRRQAVLAPAWKKRKKRGGKGVAGTLNKLKIPSSTYYEYWDGVTVHPRGLGGLGKELGIKLPD